MVSTAARDRDISNSPKPPTIRTEGLRTDPSAVAMWELNNQLSILGQRGGERVQTTLQGGMRIANPEHWQPRGSLAVGLDELEGKGC